MVCHRYLHRLDDLKRRLRGDDEFQNENEEKIRRKTTVGVEIEAKQSKTLASSNLASFKGVVSTALRRLCTAAATQTISSSLTGKAVYEVSTPLYDGLSELERAPAVSLSKTMNAREVVTCFKELSESGRYRKDLELIDSLEMNCSRRNFIYQSHPDLLLTSHHHNSTTSYIFSILPIYSTLLHIHCIHAHLIVAGILQTNIVIATQLLLSYCKCNELFTYALPFFLSLPQRNSHTWTTMLGELSRSGFPYKSVELFIQMMRSEETTADAFSVPVFLRSCASVGMVEMGVAGHGMSLKWGLESNVFVGSALVHMYVSFKRLGDARVLFDGMQNRDMVLWTTMLSGYAQSEEPELAVGVLRKMVDEDVELDGVVMISLLLVCARLGWLRVGKSVHGWSVRKSLRLGLSWGNAIMDMYVKCADLSYAERVFWRMKVRDVISWSSIIVGHGLNGNAEFALELFERMQEKSTLRPNLVTFLGVLSACAHAGLVEKGWKYWHMMKQHDLVPELKHYACMVDVLGRAGLFTEAEKFIEKMPMEPDEVVWASLLAGCRVHGNVEVGERVSEKLMMFQPERSGYYALLANLYTDSGRFEDAERVRDVMKQMNVGKVPGCSSIELGSDSKREADEVR